MKTEASLLQAIAAAPTFREQAPLVAELDALRAATARRVQDARDVDLTNTIVAQTLTPVLTHSFHTASTDWLSETEMPAVDHNAVHAEASLWFGRTASFVREDAEEFTEQARGFAHRFASQFGEQAPEAEKAFLDYVAFLHRREGASGLPQVQQLVDGNNQSARTELPTDVFDNFAPEIDPQNVGIDEAQSSDNAPLLQEILQAGQGVGQPEVGYQHGEYEQNVSQPAFPMKSAALDAPSLALGYIGNLDDFRREATLQAQAGEVPEAFKQHQKAKATDGDEQDEEPEPDAKTAAQIPSMANGAQCKDCGFAHNEAKGGGSCLLCGGQMTQNPSAHYPEKPGLPPFDLHSRIASSQLPQVQQIEDADGNYAPTPLPTDVAFPLLPFMQQYTTAPDGDNPKPKTQASKTAAPDAPAGVSNNPLLGHTLDGEDKKVEEPSNAMSKAVTSSADYRKGKAFAEGWKAGDNLVTQGSLEFEAGLYDGISANRAHQQAWLDAHVVQAHLDPFIARRPQMHLEFTALRKQAATTTDLDSMEPGLNVGNDRGETPIQGMGEVPPLAGKADAAAPAGAAPYNGAEPFGVPVAPQPGWQDPRQRRAAFAARVQTGLQAQAGEAKVPVCRGCGEAFESRSVAEGAHGKTGCGTETGERGYEMKRESDAW